MKDNCLILRKNAFLDEGGARLPEFASHQQVNRCLKTRAPFATDVA